MGTLSKPKLGCAVQNWSKFDKLFTLYFLLLKSDLLLLHLHLHLHLLLLRAAVAVVKASVAKDKISRNNYYYSCYYYS